MRPFFRPKKAFSMCLCFFSSNFLVYDDDQPPNSAISISGLSTATPPAVVGHRFFGPDFNIDQLKGKLTIVDHSIR